MVRRLLNEGWGMVSRRVVFGGGLASLALAGCGGQQPVARRGGDVYIDHPPAGPTGLDAVIDISHGVAVSDFGAIRRSGILGLIHKATEGGDWVDQSYSIRRPQAETGGAAVGRLSLRQPAVFRFRPGDALPLGRAAGALDADRPRPRAQRGQSAQHHDPAPGRGLRAGRAPANRPAAAALHPSAMGQRPGNMVVAG